MHGRQIDELSLSEILGTQNRLTMRKHTPKVCWLGGFNVSSSSRHPSRQGIHLCPSYKMPVISNPETELDMNSALLCADFHV